MPSFKKMASLKALVIDWILWPAESTQMHRKKYGQTIPSFGRMAAKALVID
jgi:hypothetical protein